MGSVQLTHEELEAMLDRAAKRGARAALQSLVSRRERPRDLDELRGLLSAWRETRTTMRQTVVRMATTGALMFIAAAIWMSFKDKVGQ